MKYEWKPFSPEVSGTHPPERRYVLVQLGPDTNYPYGNLPPSVVVGYLKYSAGDKNCPYFVLPGVIHKGRYVTHYCDCLGDDFQAPLWYGTQKTID